METKSDKEVAKTTELLLSDETIEWSLAWSPFKEAVLKRASWFAITKCLCLLNRQWRSHCKREARYRCRQELQQLHKIILRDYLPEMRACWSSTPSCSHCSRNLSLFGQGNRAYRLVHTRTWMRKQPQHSLRKTHFLCGSCYYAKVSSGDAHLSDYALVRSSPQAARAGATSNIECIGRPKYAALFLTYSVPQRYDLQSLFVDTSPSILRTISICWFQMILSGQTEIQFSRLSSQHDNQQRNGVTSRATIDLMFNLCIGNIWDWLPIAWMHAFTLRRIRLITDSRLDYCFNSTIFILQCCNPTSKFYGNKHYFYRGYWYSSLRGLEQFLSKHNSGDSFDFTDSEQSSESDGDDNVF